MATANKVKSKSNLDRLLSANRKGKSGSGSGGSAKKRAGFKGKRRVLPPEQRLGLVPEVDEEVTEIDMDLEPDTDPEDYEIEPESLPEPPDSDPEDSINPEVKEGSSALASEASREPVGVLVQETPETARVEVQPRPIVPPRPRLTSTATSAVPVDYDTSIPGQITITLDAPVRNAYAVAKPHPEQPLREYLAERLTRCQYHSDEKSIYLDSEQVQALEKFANKNFTHSSELVDWVLNGTTIRLGTLRLTLEPELIERVESRMDADQTLEEALSEYLTAGVEIKTGLRG